METKVESKLPTALHSRIKSLESATRHVTSLLAEVRDTLNLEIQEEALSRVAKLQRSLVEVTEPVVVAPRVDWAIESVAERDAKDLEGTGADFLRSVFTRPGFILAAGVSESVLREYLYELGYFYFLSCFTPELDPDDDAYQELSLKFAKKIVAIYKRNHELPLRFQFAETGKA